MPIYEYICHECQERFEKLIRQPQNAPASPHCPLCDSTRTKRVMSSFAHGGAAGVDPAAARAEWAQHERMASITPKEQIDKWRSQRSKKT